MQIFIYATVSFLNKIYVINKCDIFSMNQIFDFVVFKFKFGFLDKRLVDTAHGKNLSHIYILFIHFSTFYTIFLQYISILANHPLS